MVPTCSRHIAQYVTKARVRTEARRNQSQAAGIVGRHRSTGDQVPGERQRGGVTVVVRRGGFHVAAFRSYQSRSSSLMEVLARV